MRIAEAQLATILNSIRVPLRFLIAQSVISAIRNPQSAIRNQNPFWTTLSIASAKMSTSRRVV